MTRYLSIFFFILAIPFLNGCFKEDEMLPAPPHGNVKTDTIAMTGTYKYQVWFRLDSGVVVSTNAKTVCDIGFECSADGWHVILNTSDFVRVADLGMVPFGAICDTSGVDWKFDKSDGNQDSIAIGRWFVVNAGDTVSNNHVYLIDRGLDELGNSLGFVQVVFDSLKNSTYYFRYTGWKGGAVKTASVTKDLSVNYLYFSFTGDGSVQHVEPPKEQYDLEFTQYTTLLFTDEGAAYPYLVTGVLSNRRGVLVATDTVTDFSAITLETAKNFNYSQALDAIGYLWKFYDFEAGTYTVTANLHYVIRDPRGFYYKLRFIGFYDKTGEKGYPVIEYQRL
jgi:hypothetical protein